MSNPDQSIWEGMLSHLRVNHSSLTRQWFSELEPLGVFGGQFHLRAHTDLHRDYLHRSCAQAFNDTLVTVSGRLLSVRFLGPEDDVLPTVQTVASTILPPTPTQDAAAGHAGAQNGTAPPTPPSRIRRDESLIINPDYSFENFVVGPTNNFAHAAAVAVANDPGRTYNPLFIHGGVGLGKTHLLQAICLRVYERNPLAVMYYISCETFGTRFIEAVQAGEMADFRHRFRDLDVLVIDDIHFLTKRDRTQEEFFHTFNSLYQAGKQIVLSSDAPPHEIPDLEDRLVSRFKWGLVAKVDPPCYETRVAILKTKARVRAVELADDVAFYIAGKIDTNIRELEGAVTKLQMQASVDKRPIDLAMARAALGDTDGAPSEVSIQTIISSVCEFYRVRLTDLQSKKRHRSVALPRQICMCMARRLTRHSLEEIGGYFGGRDHTTVMHAVKTVEARRQRDPEFDTVVRSIEERTRPTRPVLS